MGSTIDSYDQELDTTFIQIVHPVCCGLDVHKKKISACLITIDEQGKEQYEIKEFGTFTNDLFVMRKWLTDNNCPIVAMESTGVYWRPVHNVLEGFMEVILVNAKHIKNVPGRKTDISDSKWLAGLLRHGLLRGSFIPPKEIRKWRELTRLRRIYTESLADYKRRIHKLFETANIKIDSVVSDLFGVTGRNLISLLCDEAELSLSNISTFGGENSPPFPLQLGHWAIIKAEICNSFPHYQIKNGVYDPLRHIIEHSRDVFHAMLFIWWVQNLLLQYVAVVIFET